MEEVDIKSTKGTDRLGDWSGEPVEGVVRGTVVSGLIKQERRKGDFCCTYIREMKVCERNLGWSGECQDG